MEQPERGSIRDLACYRIETSKSDLCSANILLKEREYKGANNRAYFHASDYDDFYVTTKENAEGQIMTAKELIEQIEMYCLGRINE